MSAQVWNHLTKTVSKQLDVVPHEAFAGFTNQVLENNTIFVVGAGRSGLVGKFFAMRLMHLGKSAHIVGETTTPGIGRDNLLVCISGSGNTASIVNASKTALKNGARVTTITANRESNLGALSNSLVLLPKSEEVDSCGRYVPDRNSSENELNIMPMGTLFELSALIFLESVIAEIIMECCVQEVEMKQRHTNLE